MKRMKKLIALMVAMMVLCLSVLSVFAQDTVSEEVNVYKLLENLRAYYAEYYYTFRIELEQDPGALPLDCYLDSASEFIEVGKEFNDFYMAVTEERVPTVEEINSFYPRLDAAAEKIILYRRELKYLIDYCSFETNDDSYYPQDLWKDFQDCLEKAVNVYAEETEEIEVSYAYWDLKFAYNELCVVNTVSGDVDNSGEFSIFDVTLVQNNIAQMCSFNSSQLTVLDELAEENITIMDVTKLQRALAKLEKFSSYNLEVLRADTHRMSLNNNRAFKVYRYNNYQGGIII
ncbi:MAG: hypothetical protein IJ275_03565 [Ruminococcus sp.]|nr:hypothetical protein [Ruminococcus sp.]